MPAASNSIILTDLQSAATGWSLGRKPDADTNSLLESWDSASGGFLNLVIPPSVARITP